MHRALVGPFLFGVCFLMSKNGSFQLTTHSFTILCFNSMRVGEWICQSCILSPCLFNFYAEYIMQNTKLDASQAGIKITGRHINNLRYAAKKEREGGLTDVSAGVVFFPPPGG